MQCLRSVRHPNIIRLEEVIESEDFLFLVLELAEGGDLYRKMTGSLAEEKVKLIFYQLASAVEYLHSRNICHRDLKPENVLLVSSDQHNLHVKIADMGLSKLVEKTHLKTFCGTRYGRNIFRILNFTTNILTQAVHGSGDL